MRHHRGAEMVAAAIAIGTLVVFLVAVSVWQVDVRHSAPYGFSKTIDFDRSLAVTGGYVTANYQNFDRVDLDLRAYSDAPLFDLTLHIKPVGNADDARTLRLDLSNAEIRFDKPAMADPFTTVRFPPLADSAGRSYYVWIERGPRNREDVVTVWSIKSYSRVPAREVLAAILDRVGPGWGFAGAKVLLGLAGVAFAAAAAWTAAAFIPMERRPGRRSVPTRGVGGPA